jgi:hypothetical protein
MTTRIQPSDITGNPVHRKYRADIDGLRALAVLSVAGLIGEDLNRLLSDPH